MHVRQCFRCRAPKPAGSGRKQGDGIWRRPGAVDKYGASPLWKAASNGHTATVVALVQECGADVGAADIDGTTPVAIAAQNFHMATVWALLMARFPVVWKGSVNLKNQRVPVRLHELDANCHSLSGQLPAEVTVTQRMKLEEEQIKMFSEELRQHNGRYRTLIGHADDEAEGVDVRASSGSVSGQNFNAHLVK